MTGQVEFKRIWTYLVFAFGISWATGLVIFLRGGLTDSRELVPDTGITEAILLVAGIYMMAPAMAHLLTRLVTREGWRYLGLRPQFRANWQTWLAAWLGTAGLLILGALVYFIVLPGNLDRDLAGVARLLTAAEEQTGQSIPLTPLVFLFIQLIQALLLAPVLNLIAVFGEEFGWRGYLQSKLMPLGWRKAMVWTGLIWGVWHWPLIAMGHAYGLEYPGAPWTGMLAFTWFAFVLGTVFGWWTLRADSVWPAVIGHAVLNGLAPGVFLVLVGQPNPLLGPSAAGLIGGLGFTLLALWLLWFRDPGKDRIMG